MPFVIVVVVVFVIVVMIVGVRVIVTFVAGLGIRRILIVLEGVCGTQLLCLPGARGRRVKKRDLAKARRDRHAGPWPPLPWGNTISSW